MPRHVRTNLSFPPRKPQCLHIPEVVGLPKINPVYLASRALWQRDVSAARDRSKRGHSSKVCAKQEISKYWQVQVQHSAAQTPESRMLTNSRETGTITPRLMGQRVEGL